MTAKEYNKLKEGTPIRIKSKSGESAVIKNYTKYEDPLFNKKWIIIGKELYSYKEVEIVKENINEN